MIVTRASNNYGPRQYPEKLIPLFITNAMEDEPLPLYGDGLQVRDWLHVEDHCRALDLVIEKGQRGTTYNIGGGTERSNLELTRAYPGAGEKAQELDQKGGRPGPGMTVATAWIRRGFVDWAGRPVSTSTRDWPPRSSGTGRTRGGGKTSSRAAWSTAVLPKTLW